MLTWTEAYQKAQAITGDTSADSLILLKSDINQGNRRLNAALNRYFTRRSKSTDVVANQQYYQLPPDCIRVVKVRALQSTSGTVKYPVRQVRSEQEWDALNTVQQTGNWATYFFVRGSDEIGIWPTPSSSIVNGLEIAYETRDKELSQEDYTTGTVTVTNGSVTVTGASTVFTESMVGRGFKVTDGSDGYAYKVAGYTSGTSITLEEPYIGLSGSGKTYKIGETFLYPDEYHDAPVDYAVARYFEQRNQQERAMYHMARFDSTLRDAREKYASSSQSAIITDRNESINWWLIPPEPVT